MIRIAVCDDDRHYLDTISGELEKLLKNQQIEMEIEAFDSGHSILQRHRQSPFDVLFLDIDMPDVTGFEIAKSIRVTSPRAYVIFVTCKHDLVYESFEYQPFYFLCKSAEQNLMGDLHRILGKLLPLYKQSRMTEIADRAIGSLYIPIKDILYIQSDRHYLLYHLTKDDPVPIRERKVLSVKEDELSSFDFFKPHRRYLVNMHHVGRFDLTVNAVLMSNGASIPISRSLRDEAFEHYRKFMRR